MWYGLDSSTLRTNAGKPPPNPKTWPSYKDESAGRATSSGNAVLIATFSSISFIYLHRCFAVRKLTGHSLVDVS